MDHMSNHGKWSGVCLRPGLLGTLASGDDVDFTGQNGDFLTHGIYWDVKSP